MRYSIYLRPDAEVDLEEAAQWYEKQREGLGRDFLNEVQHTWNAMAENPPIVTRPWNKKSTSGKHLRMEPRNDRAHDHAERYLVGESGSSSGLRDKKTRPCVVLTHNAINRLRPTVVVVPLSTAAKSHPPITVPVSCQRGPAVAVVDQIRAVSKHRLKNKIESLPSKELDEICQAVTTILEIR